MSRRKAPRYGILGGTFDPPHLGHLVLAQEMWAQLHLDRVWLLPAGTPPHKAGRMISDAADRRAMVELAIAHDERFALSTVELDRPGPSYTVETLEQLRVAWGEAAWIALIVGWDMLEYFPQWRDPAGVVERVDCLVAAHRPGFEAESSEVERLAAGVPGLREKLIVVPAPQLDLAASSLRERVASGLPIRYLVPDSVCAYIEKRGLYRGSGNARRGSKPPTHGTVEGRAT